MTTPEGMPGLRAPHLHQAVGRCMIDLSYLDDVTVQFSRTRRRRSWKGCRTVAAQLARSIVADRVAIRGSINEDFVCMHT